MHSGASGSLRWRSAPRHGGSQRHVILPASPHQSPGRAHGSAQVLGGSRREPPNSCARDSLACSLTRTHSLAGSLAGGRWARVHSFRAQHLTVHPSCNCSMWRPSLSSLRSLGPLLSSRSHRTSRRVVAGFFRFIPSPSPVFGTMVSQPVSSAPGRLWPPMDRSCDGRTGFDICREATCAVLRASCLRGMQFGRISPPLILV